MSTSSEADPSSNTLLSRRSSDNPKNGVFDFDTVLNGVYSLSHNNGQFTDDNSYFSDCAIDFLDDVMVKSIVNKQNDEQQSDNDDESDDSFLVPNNVDDYSSNDDLSYDVNIDEEQDGGSNDDKLYSTPYFSSPPVPDDNVPLCENTSLRSITSPNHQSSLCRCSCMTVQP